MPPFTPTPTPLPLKILLGAVSFFTLLSPITFPYFALSLHGMENFYYWQLLTSLFTAAPPIDLSFLVHLGFNLFLLWTFGISLLERAGATLFFTLYLGSGVAASASALAAMHLFSLPAFYGASSPAIYALLLSWVFLYSEAQLFLFFAFPMKGKWLFSLVVGVSLILDLTSGNWIFLFATLGALFFSYFFTLILWRASGPFSFLYPFEKKVFRLLEKISHLRKKAAHFPRSKIYDFQSGEPILSDDAFMDAMLSRISLYGESSLTAKEKKRMKEISEKKRGPSA